MYKSVINIILINKILKIQLKSCRNMLIVVCYHAPNVPINTLLDQFYNLL